MNWKQSYTRCRKQEHNRRNVNDDPVKRAWQRTARNSQRRYFMTIEEFRRKLERQGYRCALTGRPLTPDNCSIDHKKPLSRGGGNSARNLHLVVSEANRAKGGMDIAEFKNLCVDVAKQGGKANGNNTSTRPADCQARLRAI